MHTRSKSLELFYHKSLASLRKLDDIEFNTKIKHTNSDFNCDLEENNNDRIGLWAITQKLNAYDRIRSHTILSEFERAEEEQAGTSCEFQRDHTSPNEDTSETSSELSQVDCPNFSLTSCQSL